MIFLLAWLGVSIGAVVAAILYYKSDGQRARLTWAPPPEPLQVRTIGTHDAGAYRGGGIALEVVERVAEAPPVPRGLALTCLIVGIAWLPALPIVGIGALVGDHFAQTFGLAGVPLSIAYWVVGRRLQGPFGNAIRLGRKVAVWSAIHNSLLLIAAVAAPLLPLVLTHAEDVDSIQGSNFTSVIAGTLKQPVMAVIAGMCACASLALAYITWRTTGQQRAYAEKSAESTYQMNLRAEAASHDPRMRVPMPHEFAAPTETPHIRVTQTVATPISELDIEEPARVQEPALQNAVTHTIRD